MIRHLAEFAGELRAVGVPVSMVEVIDAAEAMQHADLSSSEGLRAVLGATMVKSGRHRAAFDRTFDVFFALRGADRPERPVDPEPEDLTALIAEALRHDDRDRLIDLVGAAVDRFGNLGAGRPGSGAYHAYRVMRRLDAGGIRDLLGSAAGGEGGGLERRLAADRAERQLDVLREEVRRETLRRLIEERGAPSVARTAREPLVEDLDLQFATQEEIREIGRAVAPLARRLATRLSQRRRHGHRGRLDMRRTIRRSLAFGGALVEPRFKRPRVAKPEVVLLCDTSGSMATFARFTMQLTHAIASELSGVRSFVFVEGVDEVSDCFGPDRDFETSLPHVLTSADVNRVDGHSDYGRSLSEFTERYGASLSARTTVIIVGDARTNYRPPRASHLESIARRSRAVFWLNPEPERFWDTGDSVIGQYRSSCDRVDEVRSLRQLERFIARAALPTDPDRRPGRNSGIGAAAARGARV